MPVRAALFRLRSIKVHSLIYLVGLIVIVLVVLSLFGLT
jgi:hypothetical protein